MNEHDALGLADQVEGPVKRRVAAAQNDDILAFKDREILAAVVKLSAFELLDPLHAKGTRLEGADARGDDYDL